MHLFIITETFELQKSIINRIFWSKKNVVYLHKNMIQLNNSF